jgi:hypothetical protein
MRFLGSTALAGLWRSLELLSGECVPGSTALTGCGGLQELISNRFVGVGENAHYRAEVQGALAHLYVRLPEEWPLYSHQILLDYPFHITSFVAWIQTNVDIQSLYSIM